MLFRSICFQDRTFCDAECAAKDCSRMLTDGVIAAAERWWGGPDAPICISDMSDTCEKFVAKENE